jgi:uncharacterized membrane protein
MTFNINDALTDGWDRFTTTTGLQLVVAFVAAAVAAAIVTNSMRRVIFVESGIVRSAFAEAPAGAYEGFQSQFVGTIGADFLTLPLGTLAALWLVVWLIQLLLSIGAMRWFVEREADSGLAGSLFTRRLLWTVGNLIVGSILYSLAVLVGLVLLIVPGIYLAVALFFYNYEIVVEGENALEALSNSWSLTSGYRLDLFLLGLLFAVLGMVLGGVTGPFAITDPTARALVNTAASGVLSVFSIAVAACAYRQLAGAGPDVDVAAS